MTIFKFLQSTCVLFYDIEKINLSGKNMIKVDNECSCKFVKFALSSSNINSLKLVSLLQARNNLTYCLIYFCCSSVLLITEVRNSQVTKLSYETELRKMTSHFELLTRKCLQKFFFRVTNSTF